MSLAGRGGGESGGAGGAPRHPVPLTLFPFSCRDRTWLSIALVVAFIILFFLLIAACILRVGTDALCASIVQTKSLSR